MYVLFQFILRSFETFETEKQQRLYFVSAKFCKAKSCLKLEEIVRKTELLEREHHEAKQSLSNAMTNKEETRPFEVLLNSATTKLESLRDKDAALLSNIKKASLIKKEATKQ
ncbi:hypothetical protein BCR33DRAFT_836034 [Rhizoclosmatium globosum]|uniref:Uncharacterized protein n=1 Tax=Rhizoclosmatium globosum TaxID=329046 RepID=A0A1Y2BN47_9FUNG|nr:hypothetical protein BCR33DRAFT_836034 [Rhizoclosmatium globosum]|eukprot:ORY36188.1 hypothetical protein BCR33DRAFT_836034 [Rhizoclosmatium globosum]